MCVFPSLQEGGGSNDVQFDEASRGKLICL